MKYDWHEHPWTKTGMVELWPADILYLLSNPEVSNTTDDVDGVIKPASEVWEGICEDGLRDPLLVVINIERQSIRLEAGNHRVIECIAGGGKMLPVATLVHHEPYFHQENGRHLFDASQLINFDVLLKQNYPYQVKIADITTQIGATWSRNVWFEHLKAIPISIRRSIFAS